jgi:alcohol dehydrogenase class IV
MAEAMEISDHSVTGFIAEIEAILDEIRIPKSLGEIGVPMDCAERIAVKALKDSAAKTNPRSASLGEVRELIEIAIKKAR